MNKAVKIRANKGEIIEQHKHEQDHMTVYLDGSFLLRINDNGNKYEKQITAPDYFLVEKQVEHSIESLEDGGLFWCIFRY